MKTTFRRSYIAIGLTGFLLFNSCSKPVSTGNTIIGINVIYHALPAVANSVNRYSKTKLSDYLLSRSNEKNTEVITVKKVIKVDTKLKAKPITIGSLREAPLI